MKPTDTPSMTPCDALWERYFLVRYNRLDSLDVATIRERGMRVSGVKEYDDTLSREMITTTININAMFELWRKGVVIHVVNYNDTVEIYKVINQHLVTWVNYLKGGINVGKSPIEELMELDKFAHIVYDHAKYVFTEEVKSGLGGIFMDEQRVHAGNILKKNRPLLGDILYDKNGAHNVIEKHYERPEDKPIERAPLADLFTETLKQVRGWQNG